METQTGQLRRELSALKSSLEGTEDSLVRQRDFLAIVGYLIFNVLCAAPLSVGDVSKSTKIILGTLILSAFLILSRLTIRRLRSLGEFEQLILYRSMASAGLIAVWVVLFVGLFMLVTGIENLFLAIAIGPPEFWLCSALFARGLEHAYRRPGTAS